jgi:hypothetical protein
MTKIETQFNAEFSHWSISMPPEDVAARRRGEIIQAGWTICYLFGVNEKGEYLDYFASHRMTNDRHARIYASGEREALPTLNWYRVCCKDPEEDKQAEAEFIAENQRIGKMLDEKWGWCKGDEMQ